MMPGSSSPERVVGHLEQSGFHMDEDGQALRRRSLDVYQPLLRLLQRPFQHDR
jgi:hypothetical protein